MGLSALEEKVRVAFEHDTREHRMTIRHDDGLYRHLRFAAPGTYMYGYDLVTWPGHLAIVGDGGGSYIFTRVLDMIEFFASDSARVNPQYWAEKVRAGAGVGDVEVYSPEAFRDRVLDWARDYCSEWGGGEGMVYESLLAGALRRELLRGVPYNEYEAREQLAEYDWLLGETWEWSFRDYDYHYLWSCYAIARGVAEYRAAVPV